MDEIPPQALRLIASRFKLLANPTRLAILQHICEEERSVGELVDLTGFRQANVSNQLGMMLRGGLVKRRSQGGRVYYQLAEPSLPQLCHVMQESIRNQQGEILAHLIGNEASEAPAKPKKKRRAPRKTAKRAAKSKK